MARTLFVSFLTLFFLSLPPCLALLRYYNCNCLNMRYFTRFPEQNGSYFFLLLLTTLVHLVGMMLIDVMDVDAAQYASMSREMAETGSYLEVKHRGADYLDKPPLLFWLSALFYSIFGVSGFVYRLPSFLSTLLGVYATYRLGRLYYGEKAGRLAALVLYSCQAYFMFTHDVRTDTILANMVAFASWQLAEYLSDRGKWRYFIGAFVGVALALMEKGPIGLMVPALAFGPDLLLKRDWKNLFRPAWLLGAFIVLICLLPMFWGLYNQFGWHGIYFFVWLQSFGRITGENIWKDDSDPLFFTHTFLWAFMPWMVVAVFALYGQARQLIAQKFNLKEGTMKESVTFFGFVFPFIALSASQYKLPHYIFVMFPYAAVLSGYYLIKILESDRLYRVFYPTHAVISVLLWLLIGLLVTAVFPGLSVGYALLALLLLAGGVYFARPAEEKTSRLFLPAFFAILGVNLLMNTHFYPSLMQYHTGRVAAEWIRQQQLTVTQVYYMYHHSQAFDFYNQAIVPELTPENIDEVLGRQSEIVVFTGADGVAFFKDRAYKWEELHKMEHFHVTTLTIPFLIPSTRAENIEQRYLLRVVR